MKHRGYLAVAFIALATCGVAAEDKPYRVNSKDVGWDSIDVTISEVSRKGPVSVLRIPHYESRTAVEARFAMCAFTDMAIRRDFVVWIVSGARAKDDLVRVGFLKSENEDAAKLLGAEFVADNALRTSVDTINVLCGIRKAK